MPTAQKSWKFLTTGKSGQIVSQHGSGGPRPTVWELGTWKHCSGSIYPCLVGFHCSRTPYDAYSYVQGSVLARVEVKGTRVSADDAPHKEAVSDMRVVRAAQWGPYDAVALSLYAASLAVESLTTDKRRKVAKDAVAAAKLYLHNRTPVEYSVIDNVAKIAYSTSSERQRYGLYAAQYAADAARIDGKATPGDTHDLYSSTYAVSYAAQCVDGVDK